MSRATTRSVKAISKPEGKPAAGLSSDEIVCSALASTTDAVVVSTPTRRILSANPAALSLLGYSAADIAGLPVRELYGPEDDWMTIETALRAGGASQSLVTLRHKSGSMFDAEVSIAPAFNREGRLCGAVETFRAMKADAIASPGVQPSNAAAVRLARGLAHDFNNLLAIITGNVQLAERRAVDPALKRYLREAEQACEMGARLTRRVMSFAEDRRLAAQKIDIAAFLKSHRPMLKRVTDDAIKLTVKVARDVKPIVGDQSALENAILNLVINARDAMPSGGEIAVSASTMRISEFDCELLAIAAGDYLCISVRDTGTGMTAHTRARAFDPFFTTKDPGRGTGLGLATVFGFARQSGGTATIVSAPGKGTTVAILLPVAKAATKRC